MAKEANISEAEAEKYVLKFTKPSKAFGKEGKGENNMFYSRAQFDGIVDLVLRAYMEDPKNVSKENIKEFRNRITKLPSATQILFGRMIALDKDLAYDGACQFADAFTVNEARLEPDLFIVVSDPLREGEKKRGGISARVKTAISSRKNRPTPRFRNSVSPSEKASFGCFTARKAAFFRRMPTMPCAMRG